jgi:hypothetical protein
MKESEKIQETELYQPIHDYFVKLGFEVHAEVNGCDLAASKDGELIIIELKLNLNLDLLIQAVKRQRLTEYVYIAIPRPNYSMFSRKWKDLCFLVRRLELGLITVSLKGENPLVDIILNPSPFNREKSMRAAKKKTKSIIAEIQGRHGNYNVGGSTGKKIMTAYKENVIHIACCLKKYGQLSPKKLRELGTGKKTLSILNNNFYGWFERVERGVYKLGNKGKAALNDFPELAAYYEGILSKEDENG